MGEALKMTMNGICILSNSLFTCTTSVETETLMILIVLLCVYITFCVVIAYLSERINVRTLKRKLLEKGRRVSHPNAELPFKREFSLRGRR
jgi:hypothetical protein